MLEDALKQLEDFLRELAQGAQVGDLVLVELLPPDPNAPRGQEELPLPSQALVLPPLSSDSGEAAAVPLIAPAAHDKGGPSTTQSLTPLISTRPPKVLVTLCRSPEPTLLPSSPPQPSVSPRRRRRRLKPSPGDAVVMSHFGPEEWRIHLPLKMLPQFSLQPQGPECGSPPEACLLSSASRGEVSALLLMPYISGSQRLQFGPRPLPHRLLPRRVRPRGLCLASSCCIMYARALLWAPAPVPALP